MKKNFIVTFFLAFLAFIVVSVNVQAAEVQEGQSIDLDLLKDIDFGETIYLEDGIEVTKYTKMQASELLKEENVEYNPYSRACSTGAVSFRFPMTVKKGSTVTDYSPVLNVWTELCENSAGQYVLNKIIGTTFDRYSNYSAHGFQGTVLTSALNSGKTLFYAVDGNWITNASHTIGITSGLGSQYATVQFNASSTTNVYGYTNQSYNHILFK